MAFSYIIEEFNTIIKSNWMLLIAYYILGILAFVLVLIGLIGNKKEKEGGTET
ncbi:MAG: hypothetical protein ABIH25_05705 [Candidatus Woesearchaeota archaeon]